jgi:hypothetical protein
MTPRLVTLALRAIAHGAPEPRHEPGGMGHALPGEVEVGGLVYERVVVDGVPRLLPALKHWSWLGWVLEEMERRGYDYCMDARPTSVSWLAIRRGPVPREGGGSGVAADRPEALVSLLEATRTESAP